MNWTWDLRSRDGGMNGMEFARCITAGGLQSVLIHAAPAKLPAIVVAEDDSVVARGDVDRDGAYSPMTLLMLGSGGFKKVRGVGGRGSLRPARAALRR